MNLYSKSTKILLTGLPGCGKTTAIIKIVENLKGIKTAGFYTREIRQNGKRKGFRWTTFDGASGILASLDIKGPFRVGKYGVDVAAFQKAAVPALDFDRTDAQLFVLDEIGKMECLSDKFLTAVRRLFASETPVLATVAQKGHGLIAEVKNFPQTKLFKLTPQTRDKTITEVSQILSFLKKTSQL